MLFIPDYVKFILDKLSQNGYAAYIVGGSVRDALRGKTPDDFDVTTNASPEEVCAVFNGICRVLETGIQHGTVTVLSDGKPIEVTTFRTDGDYKDNRHPQNVTFVKTLDADLARRDFTVNAMAYSPTKGLIDLFGGNSDLENKILRCVGEANLRFNEDALRILRALRFASVLQFDIEEQTSSAIRKNRALLNNVSAERIRTELFKLLCGGDAKKILLDYAEVFFTLFPMLKDAYTHESYIKAVNYACSLPRSSELRFAAILSFASTTHKDACIRATESLKTDRKTLDAIRFVLTHADDALPKNKTDLKHALNRYGAKHLRFLLTLKKEDALIGITDEILNSGEAYRITDLDIHGEDVASLGYQGKEIGEMLNRLLCAVIEEKAENKKECLLLEIRKTMI